MIRPTYLAFATCVFLLLAGCGDEETAASVSLTSPSDGETVAGSVELVMAADAFTIEEAGEVNDGAGHFHVVVHGPPAHEVRVVVEVDDEHGGQFPEGVVRLDVG